MAAQRRIDLVLDSVKRLLRIGATANLLNLLQKQHPADLAQIFNDLPDKERERQRKLLDKLHDGEGGLIVRTAAQGAKKADFDIVYVYAGHDLTLPMNFLQRRRNPLGGAGQPAHQRTLPDSQRLGRVPVPGQVGDEEQRGDEEQQGARKPACHRCQSESSSQSTSGRSAQCP